MKGNKMNELDDIKQELKEVKALIRMLLPKGDVPISDIARKTGVTRQAVRDYITKHFEPDKDFYKKNGKLHVSEGVAIKLLQRR